MIKAYKAKYFDVREYVPEVVFKNRGEKAWELIDHGLIVNYDALRHQLGVPMTMNNWHTGGTRQESGLRIVGQPYYKPYSQHSFGRAGDTVCEIPASEIRRRIRDKEIVLPHPCVIEEFDSKGNEISWFHMDCRNMSNEHVYFMSA